MTETKIQTTAEYLKEQKNKAKNPSPTPSHIEDKIHKVPTPKSTYILGFFSVVIIILIIIISTQAARLSTTERKIEDAERTIKCLKDNNNRYYH